MARTTRANKLVFKIQNSAIPVNVTDIVLSVLDLIKKFLFNKKDNLLLLFLLKRVRKCIIQPTNIYCNKNF